MQDNPKLTQEAVAAYFWKKGFTTLDQSTISRIVRKAEAHREAAQTTGNLSFKQPRLVEFPAIEMALRAWVLQAPAKGIRITGDILHEKARRFAELEGIDSGQFLSLSNRWLDSFKQRHGLKQYRFHGEAGSTVEKDVEASRTRLRKITDKYPLHDILNMDETGLNDRIPLDRGLATAQYARKKVNKQRLTYALTTNANGSEVFPLLVIGHAQQPRCFQRKSGKDLGFDYWWNKKAWMTGSIFQGYLSNLNAKMKKEGRKVLLLVDNALSHIFNPDGLSHRAIEQEEAGEVDLYKIDQLQAMRLAAEAWDRVTGQTVANCWGHASILSPRDANGDPHKKGSLGDEEIMSQVLKDQQMERVEEGDEAEDSGGDLDETPEPVISPSEGMRYLHDLVQLFDSQKGPEFRKASHLIPKLLQHLNLAVEEAREQTKLTDYYFPWPESP
ncbi:hypothetical protein M407DRAFT_12906 [Tulasnella calospora MUT 4182]|uniref:HTH CENPB-type domain-containing protein n=1 Tax=Tulasnella calospora MUT 4182 TaxID=1051891 RepID=A0A0C3Q167_9AGAM|nr:hypothetical protein M407DRAFT_12906 [Tulasnella calospora MUT 4182]